MRFLNLENVLNYYCTWCQLSDNLRIIFICLLWPPSPQKVFKNLLCRRGLSSVHNVNKYQATASPAGILSSQRALKMMLRIFKKMGESQNSKEAAIFCDIKGFADSLLCLWKDLPIFHTRRCQSTYKRTLGVQLRLQKDLWIEVGITETVRREMGNAKPWNCSQ